LPCTTSLPQPRHASTLRASGDDRAGAKNKRLRGGLTLQRRGLALLVLHHEIERAHEGAQRHLGVALHPALHRFVGYVQQTGDDLRTAFLRHQLREHF
jgi:hypothetical protein